MSGVFILTLHPREYRSEVLAAFDTLAAAQQAGTAYARDLSGDVLLTVDRLQLNAGCSGPPESACVLDLMDEPPFWRMGLFWKTPSDFPRN